MRRIKPFLLIAIVATAALWSWKNHEMVMDLFDQYVGGNGSLTLEVRYNADQVMAMHQKELISNSKQSFQAPILKFCPYLLIDAKYTGDDRKTREGHILWSMVDGEMVLNTDTWEKSHGFGDAMMVGASRDEFKIMNALAAHSGGLTRNQLQSELRLDFDIIEPWIDSARNKRLIIQKGNELLLHFQNPKILVSPQTKIGQWLVTKPYKHIQRIAKNFSQKQIVKTAKAAFGTDFTIRSIKEVALPIHCISVVNADGTVHMTHWNALNGKKMQSSSIAYSAG